MPEAEPQTARRGRQSRSGTPSHPPTTVCTRRCGPGYLGSRAKDMKPGDCFDIRHETHDFIVRGYIMDVDSDAGMLAFVTTELIDLTQIDMIAFDYADCTVSREQGGWAVIDRHRVEGWLQDRGRCHRVDRREARCGHCRHVRQGHLKLWTSGHVGMT